MKKINYQLPMSSADQDRMRNNYAYALDLLADIKNKANGNNTVTRALVDDFITERNAEAKAKRTLN